MNLVLFTSISPLLESIALMNECICVDLDDSIHQRLKEIGISSIALRSPGDKDWESRDIGFSDLAMPGIQLDKPFGGTELPMWKVLSIDRYNFWYRGMQAKREFETVMSLKWDRGYVPLEMNHPLPFALARYSNREVVGVQTSPIRNREWLDIISFGLYPFKTSIMYRIADLQFLQKRGISSTLQEFPDPIPNPVTPEEKKAVRAGLGIDGNIALVLFDSQTEWEFRMSLPFLLENYQRVLVYPVHHYDYANLQSLGVIGATIQMVDTLSVEPAADEAIIYRYDANLLIGRRIPVRVMDLATRWNIVDLSN
jgi:hypothetical protein